MYTDPSGNKIDGFDIWRVLMFPVFLPARLLSEGVTWVNDRINGDSRPNGYFNWSYLCGRTEPGGFFNYSPANAVPYGHQSSFAGGIAFGTGFALGADNEWDDYIFHIFNKQEYVRKSGSKKLTWLSKNAAASGGFTVRALGKLLLGTYVGKFEGVDTYEALALGKYTSGGYAGVTIPEKGIFVGLGVYSNDEDMMRHEFGHILQYRKYGASAYWRVIAPESLWSASKHRKNGWNHDIFWTETYANYLSRNYFGRQAFNDGWDSFYWNYKEYPVENISSENLLRLSR
jgi:hypothetical protein